MAYRVRMFIDFWNYQLQWNARHGCEKHCDWRSLPSGFVSCAQEMIEAAGITECLQLEETRVYASYNPAKDGSLRGWLSNFLDRQPSYRVFATERKDKPASIYCRECQQVFDACPSCGKTMMRSREKGVDTAIVTDLLSLAWEDAYEVAVLISSDADMIPCVERLQEKGLKIINGMWAPLGQDLAKACWASFDIGKIAPKLVR